MESQGLMSPNNPWHHVRYQFPDLAFFLNVPACILLVLVQILFIGCNTRVIFYCSLRVILLKFLLSVLRIVLLIK